MKEEEEEENFYDGDLNGYGTQLTTIFNRPYNIISRKKKKK